MGHEDRRVHGGARRQDYFKIRGRIPSACHASRGIRDGGKRVAGKASADPPDLAYFIQGAGSAGLFNLAAIVGAEDPIWGLSASAILQLFHAEASRNGARLRWVNWPEASQESIQKFERIAAQGVELEGI